MKNNAELTKCLKELQGLTGVKMELSFQENDNQEEILIQMRHLVTAYKEKFNKTEFLFSLMKNDFVPTDISERARRLHIESDILRTMILVELKSPSEFNTTIEILKNLIDTRPKTLFVPISHCQIVILKPCKVIETEDDIKKLCHMLVDTLNSEALVSVHMSFSETFDSLLSLSEKYKECALALRIGTLFQSELQVFSHSKVGVGRLIGELPLSVCEDFLREIFGRDLNKINEILDEETQSTLNRFIYNDQNIAETAKQLHMHRNTLILRLDKIEKTIGLDLRKFADAMTYKIAAMVNVYYQNERKLRNE